METLLTTTDAARLLAVAPASVKRWADAGLLPCVRTAGRHRRFRPGDIADFRSRLGATSPGGWVDFLVRGGDAHLVHSRLLTERGVRSSWLETAEALLPVVEELGARWQRGELRVDEEHVASDRLARGLSRCAEALPIGDDAPIALLATPEDEDHTLGLSLAEVVLREAGVTTRWTGRQTPCPSIEAAIESGDVGMVVLAASALRDGKSLARTARKVGASGRRAGVPVVLGGAGPWPTDAPGTTRLTTFSALAEWARRQPTST